jgi:hypothetical protein
MGISAAAIAKEVVTAERLRIRGAQSDSAPDERAPSTE